MNSAHPAGELVGSCCGSLTSCDLPADGQKSKLHIPGKTSGSILNVICYVALLLVGWLVGLQFRGKS